jgi:hypothetical protein
MEADRAAQLFLEALATEPEISHRMPFFNHGQALYNSHNFLCHSVNRAAITRRKIHLRHRTAGSHAGFENWRLRLEARRFTCGTGCDHRQHSSTDPVRLSQRNPDWSFDNQHREGRTPNSDRRLYRPSKKREAHFQHLQRGIDALYAAIDLERCSDARWKFAGISGVTRLCPSAARLRREAIHRNR